MRSSSALARAAHHANNALAAILANLELAEAYAPQGKAQEAIGRAIDAARLHAALMRLHAPAAEPERQPEPLDLATAVGDIARLLDRNGFPLEAELAPDLPAALIGPELLETLIAGLVCALRPALPETARLRLSAGLTGLSRPAPGPSRKAGGNSFVRISISAIDIDGPLAQVWGQMHCAGSPLLASVVQLARANGGSAILSEHDGGGAEIVLRIPLPRARDEPEGADATAGSIPLGDGELVLVTGKDSAALELLHRKIEGLGYSVVSATNAAEAMAVTDTPDLIVLLGSSEGEETLARELSRRHPRARTILGTDDAGIACGCGHAGGCVERSVEGSAAYTRAALALALRGALGAAHATPLDGFDAGAPASLCTSPTKT